MTSIDKHAATWALVPLKSTDRAKSRLADVLSPVQRERLLFALAERVINALRMTPGIDNVAVVTASPAIADFSRALQAVPLLQAADAGMSVALASGLDELHALQPQRVVMVPGDLPLISPAILTAFLADAEPAPGITLVPDRHRAGTNLLLCAPAHAIAPCFGGHSFERHLAAAAGAGVQARVLQIEELALDLDEPQDLDYLRTRHGAIADQLLGVRNADVGPAPRRTAATG